MHGDNVVELSFDWPVPPHRRVRLAGLSILLLGGIAAAVVFVVASREGDAGTGDVSRSEATALERIGGKATARTVAFDRWLVSLWHGERLAWTLAALALVVGGSCLHLAGLMREGGGEEKPDAPLGPPPGGRR